MKIFKLILLINIFSMSLQAQSWQWANRVGNSNDDSAGILVMKDGSYFLEGFFSGILYFQTDTLFSNGYNDMYLVYYSSTGTELWVKQFGGPNSSSEEEFLAGAVVDNSNSAFYLSGVFNNSLVIDSFTLAGQGLDYFLAKFDLSGNCLWLKKAGSPLNDVYTSTVALDPKGFLYWSANLLDSGSIDGINLAKGLFLAKLDLDGNIHFAKNEFKDVFINLSYNADHLYFSGTTRNDTSIIDTVVLYSTGTDAFIGCLDTAGNNVWTYKFEGPRNDYGLGQRFDALGNGYFIGRFQDTLTLNNNTLISNGWEDSYIGKFNSSGSLIWLKQSYSNIPFKRFSASSINCNPDGDFYLTGYFSGSPQIGNFNLNTNLNSEMFLARFNTDGDCVAISNFGEAAGYAVQEDTLGNVYVSGTFRNSISIGTFNLTSAGGIDMFIAKSDAITGLPGSNRAANNQLIIYANPNKGSFRIKLPDAVTTLQNAVLIVYDQTGREVSRFALDDNNDSPRFEVNSASAGMYTVKLVQGVKVFVGSMVLE